MLDDPLATVASKGMQIKHIYLLTRMYSFEQRNLESKNFLYQVECYSKLKHLSTINYS